MQIDFAFHFGQRVRILPLNADGLVVGIYADEDMKEYNVRYFDNVEPKKNYFREEELRPHAEPKEDVSTDHA